MIRPEIPVKIQGAPDFSKNAVLAHLKGAGINWGVCIVRSGDDYILIWPYGQKNLGYCCSLTDALHLGMELIAEVEGELEPDF